MCKNSRGIPARGSCSTTCKLAADSLRTLAFQSAHLFVDLRLHQEQVLLLAADLGCQVISDPLQHPLQLGL
jgi:hypothetical protein